MSDSMVFLKLQGYKGYKLTARKKENFLYSIESALKSLYIGRVLFQTKLNNNYSYGCKLKENSQT